MSLLRLESRHDPRYCAFGPCRYGQTAVGVMLVVVLPVAVFAGDIVINELMYHPPRDEDRLQYIELYNAGDSAVDLAGWSFTKGVRFVFPPDSSLPSKAHLVICRDKDAFLEGYGGGLSILGNYEGTLSHGGERVELSDARGDPVDAVTYSDEAPWPAGPDGYSSSLERISVVDSSEWPENWAPSPPSDLGGGPAGTPGARNAGSSLSLPPRIGDARFAPGRAGESEKFTASVTDPDGVKEVTAGIRILVEGRESAETFLSLERVGGDPKRGMYEVTIPGQPAGSLLRLRLRATDESGAVRMHPHPSEPRPTLSYYVQETENSARIPLGLVLRFGPERTPAKTSRRIPESQDTLHHGAFIYITPGGLPQVFDHIQIRSRRGGLKLRFHRDRPFDAMTAINLLSEGPSRWILAEALSYEVYRQAGVPAPRAWPVRIWEDGRIRGYQLLVEQPNESFLVRNRLDPTGNLYKAVWYGRDIVQKHEKKTHRTAGHEDLLELERLLRSTSGEEQWDIIRERFHVEKAASYYAVSMCISDWDGFHNNHFLYHDLHRSGKWEIYPWDKDKTWGDYDGASPAHDWYEMPLTVGMEGDRSPTLDPNSKANNVRGFDGGVGWWRKGGCFSRPLLANPRFRKLFLQRLSELLSTVFTEEKLLPLIDTMERDLEPEARTRAEAQGKDSEDAVHSFKKQMETFRRQVRHRREFLIEAVAKAR